MWLHQNSKMPHLITKRVVQTTLFFVAFISLDKHTLASYKIISRLKLSLASQTVLQKEVKKGCGEYCNAVVPVECA